MAEHYDPIIVGSGPGGASLAHRLAPTGKRILIFERGGYLPREAANWRVQAVIVDNKYQAPEAWNNAHQETFSPALHYYVGGVSPAWPLNHDAFAQYYDETEVRFHVHGRRGEDPSGGPRWLPADRCSH